MAEGRAARRRLEVQGRKHRAPNTLNAGARPRLASFRSLFIAIVIARDTTRSRVGDTALAIL